MPRRAHEQPTKAFRPQQFYDQPASTPNISHKKHGVEGLPRQPWSQTQ